MPASRFPSVFPFVWGICSCCEGHGKVENRAFSNGFTASEWREMQCDFDGDGEQSAADRYLGGAYDTPCNECKGSGKIRLPDVSRMSWAQKRVLAAQRREERHAIFCAQQSAAESAAERRVGA